MRNCLLTLDASENMNLLHLISYFCKTHQSKARLRQVVVVVDTLALLFPGLLLSKHLGHDAIGAEVGVPVVGSHSCNGSAMCAWAGSVRVNYGL